MSQGLARCGWRVGAGASSPSPNDCNRDDRRGGAGVITSLLGDCNLGDRRVGTSVVTSLVGDCNKIGMWNVLSLNKPGELVNFLKEMKRMRARIMMVAETFWDNEGSFQTQLAQSEIGD